MSPTIGSLPKLHFCSFFPFIAYFTSEVSLSNYRQAISNISIIVIVWCAQPCMHHNNAVIEHLQLFSNYMQAISNISKIVIVRCAQPFTHHSWCSDWTPSTVFHVAWYTTHCTHHILSINCTLDISSWLRDARILARIRRSDSSFLNLPSLVLFLINKTCVLDIPQEATWLILL